MPAASLSRADGKSAPKTDPNSDAKPERKILYQTYFKSAGPRTYAAQVKEAGNGNHFIVLVEGQRDKQTGELRKRSVIVFSEDFEQFAKLVGDTMQFVRAHPVSPDVAKRQSSRWKGGGSTSNKNGGARSPASQRRMESER